MMSRVRHTNMKIWDFSWQCYNITSPRDTWPGLGTLRGRGVWSRRCGSFPTRAPLSHEAQQPLYSRRLINTEERELKCNVCSYPLVFVCSCGCECCGLVSFSPSPKVGKLRVKLWVGGARHAVTRDTDMTRVWRDAGTRDTWRDLVLCHSPVRLKLFRFLNIRKFWTN